MPTTIRQEVVSRRSPFNGGLILPNPNVLKVPLLIESCQAADMTSLTFDLLDELVTIGICEQSVGCLWDGQHRKLIQNIATEDTVWQVLARVVPYPT